ncbi:hypothetical protein D7X94_18010, partial [Acutalibacter sp. 1XD8-33]
MTLDKLLAYSGGGLFVLLTLVQIAPVKVNPWSAIARWIGKAINGEVLGKLGRLETRLDEHINTDDKRDADGHRVKILQFNNELLRCQRQFEIVRKRRRNFVVFRRGGGNKTKRFLAQKECSRFAVSGA